MRLRFIDLFAGLGGFHVGLEQLEMECVFASELSKELQTPYRVNAEVVRQVASCRIAPSQLKPAQQRIELSSIPTLAAV